MASDILYVPSTSVPVECLFSQAGNVLTEKRNRFLPDTAKVLMCLKSWL